MEPVLTDEVAERYQRFALHEAAPVSAVYQAWAQGVSDDAEVAAMIGTLPARQRQPNLVFSVVRVLSPALVEPHLTTPRPDEYQRFRAVLIEHWDEVVTLTANRFTQTNEAARIAALMPALHTIHRTCGKRLALVELGASAGLLLHPHAWTYHYTDADEAPLAEFGDPQALGTLTVTSRGVPVPDQLPPIDWRIGLDLHPLNARRPEVADWLRALIWPGQTHRLARLDVALEAAGRDPVLVLERDLTRPDVLDEVLGLIPSDLQPVVFHSAVLAYLETDDRGALSQRLLERAQAGRCSWLSYEGAAVVPPVSDQLSRLGISSDQVRGDFVVAIDAEPQYLADGHAHWIAALPS